MAELKTRPNKKSVMKLLSAVENEKRRNDALKLLAIFEAVTQKKGVMWGGAIVGFGQYHYLQKNGQPTRWPMIGFSPRKQYFSLYIMPGFKTYQHLLAKLGKYKTATSCLYIKTLDDVDEAVLRQLLAASLADMESRQE